jgi:hypothetical protein
MKIDVSKGYFRQGMTPCSLANGYHVSDTPQFSGQKNEPSVEKSGLIQGGGAGHLAVGGRGCSKVGKM